MDREVRRFMADNPGCVVVSVGCGLDTRFAHYTPSFRPVKPKADAAWNTRPAHFPVIPLIALPSSSSGENMVWQHIKKEFNRTEGWGIMS